MKATPTVRESVVIEKNQAVISASEPTIMSAGDWTKPFSDNMFLVRFASTFQKSPPREGNGENSKF